MKYYKASDIIPIFIQFSKMTRKEEWNEKALKDNEPRLYRFQQIEALLKAFNVKGGIKTLEEGPFRAKKSWLKQFRYMEDLKKNPFILNEYKRLSEKFNLQSIEHEFHYIGLDWMYFIRLAYTFYSLIDSDDVKRGCFIGEMCMDVKLHFTTGSNKEQINKVFRLLGILLDPCEQEIPKEELIRKYKFPDVDLKGIDAEWF